MIVLLAVVFGVLLFGWVIAGLAVIASITIAAIRTFERMLGRPGRFLNEDAQFLRDLGIRL